MKIQKHGTAKRLSKKSREPHTCLCRRLPLFALLLAAPLSLCLAGDPSAETPKATGDFDHSLTVTAALSWMDTGGVVSSPSAAARVGVAVLDTGVYPHSDLTKPTSRILKFVDFVNHYALPYDDNGHGTAVSGIIAGSGYIDSGKRGICDNVDLICIKVLDYRGECSISKLAEGLQWVVDHKELYNIRIVNISAGIPFDEVSDYSKIAEIAEKAQKNGLLIVASSGNKVRGQNVRYFPADINGVLSVGGTDGMSDSAECFFR
ncbi:MAG: S8 family serine peptidase [Clostridium sp.]|jgi:subtilisin family serine protease|nr:S8 family serine peptidase [Clostridium sp.]